MKLLCEKLLGMQMHQLQELGLVDVCELKCRFARDGQKISGRYLLGVELTFNQPTGKGKFDVSKWHLFLIQDELVHVECRWSRDGRWGGMARGINHSWLPRDVLVNYQLVSGAEGKVRRISYTPDMTLRQVLEPSAGQRAFQAALCGKIYGDNPLGLTEPI
jgi:hypothetical protein